MKRQAGTALGPALPAKSRVVLGATAGGPPSPSSSYISLRGRVVLGSAVHAHGWACSSLPRAWPWCSPLRARSSSRCHRDPPGPPHAAEPAVAAARCFILRKKSRSRRGKSSFYSLLHAKWTQVVLHLQPPLLAGSGRASGRRSVSRRAALSAEGKEAGPGSAAAGFKAGRGFTRELSWMDVTPVRPFSTLILFSDVNKGLFFSKQSMLLLSAVGQRGKCST